MALRAAMVARAVPVAARPSEPPVTAARVATPAMAALARLERPRAASVARAVLARTAVPVAPAEAQAEAAPTAMAVPVATRALAEMVAPVPRQQLSSLAARVVSVARAVRPVRAEPLAVRAQRRVR
jgi:hypothetical protein